MTSPPRSSRIRITMKPVVSALLMLVLAGPLPRSHIGTRTRAIGTSTGNTLTTTAKTITGVAGSVTCLRRMSV
jgi:hypothetical protein